MQIDPDLRSLARTYFEMRDESFVAMAERLAREVGGNFRLSGDTAILSRRGADYRAVARATWGDNLHSLDMTPDLGRPQFSAVRARWYDPVRAAWHVVERSTGLDVRAIHTARGARASEMDANQQADGDMATIERDAGEGTVSIEGNTGAVPDGMCVVVGTRAGVDGPYRIEAVNHTLTRAGGFVTSLELKRPSAGSNNA